MLESTAQRLGASNVRVEVRDAAIVHEGAAFDRVLVDPPCSGLGVLQARPDLRWRVTPAAIEEMAAAQATILAAGAQAVRPGGLLVYSTCTISPLENEQMLVSFLDSHPEFVLDELAAETPRFAAQRLDGLPAGCALLTLPHIHRTAGFFIVRLRRR
jgi:16S rRNA (cytosine967-C5)-methyltransferase